MIRLLLSRFPVSLRAWVGLMVLAVMALAPVTRAEPGDDPVLSSLETALAAAKDGDTAARKRLALKRVIRDGEQALQLAGDKPQRWALLEFLFRAQQRLIAADDDPRQREVLIGFSRELVKAPREYAPLRMEADLLISLVEKAKQGGEVAARSDALRQFVKRYIGTPVSTKALRSAMIMALEMGDTRLINDLCDIIAEHHPGDLEMIAFLRDHLGGQVFGVPFAGRYTRSDGKTVCFPMDALGHSTMVIFWSKEKEGVIQYLTNMAAAAKLDHANIDGRLELISVNLDGLADAGESIIRGVGADWPCLSLPGGRDHPIYKAYVRLDPCNLRVAPTGQVALVMADTTRKPVTKTPEQIKEEIGQIKPAEDLQPYIDNFRRTLIRGWSNDQYATHLGALMIGDFLVHDPQGGLDPAMPPELKALAVAADKGSGKVALLQRDGSCVPQDTLQAIQDCLIPPPRRYHTPITEIRSSYQKMVELCRKAIAEHPAAPDLWIVRNRLMIGLLGLWKTDFRLEHFEEAVAQAKQALEADHPAGTDLIARFCLARQALREAQVDAGAVIDGLVADCGGEKAAGPVFAVACLLALDAADAKRFHDYREAILKNHVEEPMMWIFSGFLLDRYHRYWLFQVPFTAGWSFGRRERHEMQKGGVDDAQRFLRVELPTVDGKVLRIPEDLKSEYTAIFMTQPAPWRGRERDDPNPPSPATLLRNFPRYVAERPDIALMVAIFGEADEQAVRENLKISSLKEPLEIPILELPGGAGHPLVQRLALQSDREVALLIDKQGRILAVRSGLSFDDVENSFRNMIERQDEKAVIEALEKGAIDKARDLIMKIAPPYDPEARDERGRKLPEPKYGLAHLRARARVYMALGQWDKAMADAETVVQAQLGAAGGMSLRTPELDESEALRDEIKAKMKESQ